MPPAMQDLIAIALVSLLAVAVFSLDEGGDTTTVITKGITQAITQAVQPNSCADGSDPKRYGRSAVYDGVRISGSPEFVGLTVQAMMRTWDTPSYHYVRKIRSIEERPLRGAHAMIYPHNGRAYVDPATARWGCTLYGPVLVHEGSHMVYGHDHKKVYAVHAQSLREMGEHIHAVQADWRSKTASDGYGQSR
jgi:hypothetical protein